jgi:hypothetical protein
MGVSRSLSLAFMIAVVGCTSASIESSWRAPSTPTLTNVVTMSPVSDPGLRRSAEDKLAQQLSQHGVRATPAYQVVSDQDLGDHTRVAQTLASRGFDGVVSRRFVAANQKLEYHSGFDDYWGGAYGQVVPETVVRIEVNAYSKVASDKLASEHVIGPSQAEAR